jgi:hypothetical protein
MPAANPDNLRWFVVCLIWSPRPDQARSALLIVLARDMFAAVAQARSLTPDPATAWIVWGCPSAGFDSFLEARQCLDQENVQRAAMET